MSMILGIVTLSDANIQRVIDDPPLAWRVVAPDDPEPYEAARSEAAPAPGLFARLLRKPAQHPPDLKLSAPEGLDVDLDKAWHGIHFLLTGTAWAGNPPLNFLLEGGQTAGDLEIGYGPLRLHTSQEVHAIRRAVSDLTDEDLRARFRPAEMKRLEIYPEIWDRPPEDDDTLGYLMEYVVVLRQHLDEAAKANLGIAISIT